MLPLGTLLPVLDSVADEVSTFETAVGAIADLAEGQRDVVSMADDPDAQEDLIPAMNRRIALLGGAVLFPMLQGAMLQRALDVHYGVQGGLNRFLTLNNARVHWNLKKIGFQIDSQNVFPPVVDPVATYEGTGAGTGIFTNTGAAGSDIDTTQYGEAAMQVYIDAWGGPARTVRLTMKNFDGTTETRDVVIPLNAEAGASLDVGNAGDRYVGVANITTVGAGGSAADRLHVRSVVERNI